MAGPKQKSAGVVSVSQARGFRALGVLVGIHGLSVALDNVRAGGCALKDISSRTIVVTFLL